MERGDSQLSTSPENKAPTEPSSTLPDISEVNRKPPFVKKTSYEIQTRYDPKRFDVCGDVICTTGHLTRAWNLVDGEQLMSLAHTEGVKATAVSFKPAATPDNEGTRLWVGTNTGDVMEVEIATNRISHIRPNVHGKQDVIKLYRSYNELWSLDESGNLLVWGPDADGMPNLDLNPSQTYKIPKGHTFSMAVGSELWYATGKVLRVFAPSPDGSTTFQVLLKPLVTDGTADITSGAVLDAYSDKVFFGHVDGKVSVYSTKEYVCQAVVNVSGWKINTLTGAGSHLWVGYSNGRICVYDTAKTPWVLKKEWQAHDGGIYQVKLDTAAPYKLSRSQVVSLGPDGKAKIWDGLLQDDWIESDFKAKADKYCEFDQIKLMVMTWNAGASTPHSLRYSDGDSTFIQELLHSSGSPDILVFGFQELVDLEDKTATAKRFLKSKKKDGSDIESMSHRYRDWRDFLLKSLDDYMPADDLYHLLFNAPLVGLFSCVFVKSTLQPRISNLQGAEVKRGMGGLHGNKGAVAVRFHIDDTSLCLINCHLAAGQTQTASRHNDVAGIMEASLFPTGRDSSSRLNCYSGGGDGSMIIDHELCILNGDLNYRIDTMSRDTVAKAVQQGNLTKLLERDQLLVSRRKNPIFRLRAFDELPLTFAPTYKYDVGTDRYDTSEKRRSPAWCDRVLYRGKTSVEQLDYKRHEVRVSDHRPVTARFRLRVKKINDRERAAVWMESTQGFEDVREKRIQEAR
jgi:endonuclease/exonuclease/phosphatase family metal-dependent hydrolase